MTTYAYQIELTDYTFIALKNLLEDECKKLEEQHGIVAYDESTGETKHAYGVILKTMSECVDKAEQRSAFVSNSRNAALD
jgi:fructose-bisphosphate aldolase class 1